MRSIRDNLAMYPRLLRRKAALFLNDRELADNYSFYSFRRFSRTLSVAPTFAWVAVPAAAGVVLSLSRWKQLVPLYIAGAGYMASVMIFFNFARFRLPFIPILLVFAGHGVATMWAIASGRDRAARAKRVILGASAAAVSLVIATLPVPVGLEDPFQDRLHLGAAYRHAGRSIEAEQQFRETIGEAERYLANRRHESEGVSFALALHAAHKGLAGALLDQGRNEEAIDKLRALIRIDERDADLFWMLGAAHRARGDLVAAAAAYSRGLDREPQSVALRLDLARALLDAGDAAGARSELLRTKEMAPGLAGADLAAWDHEMERLGTAMPEE
jgi:tetratricopeptide (TPR) repeat protein